MACEGCKHRRDWIVDKAQQVQSWWYRWCEAHRMKDEKLIEVLIKEKQDGNRNIHG